MSASGFGGAGFPAPGAMVGQAAQPAGIVINIPADPTWEPFDVTDQLEMDGYYACRIKKEAGRSDPGKSPGVFLTLELQDQDAMGKMLSKFMPDPNSTKGNTFFLWRGIARSIMGDLQLARTGFQYTPGTFANQPCYVRTGAYLDDGGSMRTGVDAFVTQAEYTEAVKAGKHRWPARVKSGGAGAGAGSPIGALPSGLPGGFPGGGGPGLPGAPSGGGPFSGAAQAPTTPQPGFAPTQAAPAAAQPAPAQTFAAPPAAPPANPFAPAGAAPAAIPFQPQPQGGVPAPFASFNLSPPPPVAPPAQNGAPAPTGASPFPFPPTPAQ